jgi:hypothetical protein
LKDTAAEGISHLRFRGEAELQTYRRKPQLPNRPDLMSKRRGHKRRIANQTQCGIAPRNKPAEISGALEVSVESGHHVVHSHYECSARVREINEVIVSSEDVEAQFCLDFPYLPANGRLHDVNTFRGSAKVQFARDS